MKIFRYLLIAIAAFVILPANAQQITVHWNNKVENLGEGNYRVLFEATIDPGWHMYDMGPYDGGPNPTEFVIETEGAIQLVGGIEMVTKPTRKFDEMFQMEIGYFDNRAVFAQKVKLTGDKGVLNVNIDWMTCNDSTCLPPTDEDFRIEIVGDKKPAAEEGQKKNEEVPEVAAASAGDDNTGDQEATDNTEDATAQPAPTGQTMVASVDMDPDGEGGSLWLVILKAMGWGLIALVTPCVFPMIPMTVSFFLKGSENMKKGRFRAMMYGIFIVVLYTLPIAAIILITRFIGGDAVTADIFNWISTHWLPNTIFFLVFMIFAASFFGAFEIRMPSSLVNKSDKNADRGGLGGVFFMALTLVLVSFSCTGPLIGTALVESTTEGNYLAPIITMLAFSIVFALPFTFFAIFPGLMQKMPGSGGWLNTVKVVLGFVEVALGLKFLSVADQTYHWGILDREVYLAIWIVCFSLLGAYLLGKLKFKHDSEVKFIGVGRLAMAIITLSFVVYLIPGMWGAPLKSLSGYMPPLSTQDFVLTPGGGGSNSVSDNGGRILTVEGNAPKYSDFLHLPLGFDGFFDIDEAQAYADKVGKPLFIDITGHGCVNCREMESKVWSDETVKNILQTEYVIVAVYVDDKKILPEDQWLTTESGKVLKGLGKINAYKVLQRYNANSQPFYVLQGRGGEVLVKPRSYDRSIPGFIDFLNSGIAAYKAR